VFVVEPEFGFQQGSPPVPPAEGGAGTNAQPSAGPTDVGEVGADVAAAEGGAVSSAAPWWQVHAAEVHRGGGEDPEAAAEPLPAEGQRRRRAHWLHGRVRAAAAGLVGLTLGVAGVVLVTPFGRAAVLHDTPVIQTVAVTPSEQAMASPVVAVYRKLSPSIVLVTNQASVQSFYGPSSQVDWGSGVVLTPSGYIVTNDHVVAGGQQITVTLASGKSYPAKLIGDDPSSDLAVIKINPPAPLTPAVFANSRDVVPGELAVAIGNPLGPEFAQSVTSGIVSAIRPMLYGGIDGTTPRVTEMIQTDAPINPGNSGGALANAQGEVIGITSMKVGQTGEPNLPAVGLGFAIPSNTVVKIVNEILRYGTVPEPWIGVAINATPASALPSQPQTLTVTQVVSGSPAARAGIQVGDVITGWQGRKVLNYWQLVQDLNRASPGQRVSLGLERQGQAVTVSLTLGTMPQSLADGAASSSSAPAPSGTAPSPSGTAPSPYPFPFPFPFGGPSGQ
jgi:serine protease Do